MLSIWSSPKLSFGNEPKPLKVNSLQRKIMSDTSKLNAFAGNKINMIMKFKFVFGRVQNIVGKEENTGHQHFLLSHNYLNSSPNNFQFFTHRMFSVRMV